MQREGELAETPTSPRDGWSVLPVWMLAFITSFLVYAGLAMLELGWHRFWQYLTHPHVHAAAFDLLAASLAGAYSVGITVYLGAVATVVVTVSERNNRRSRALLELLGSWWLFFPALFWCVATNLLSGTAWGFPRLVWGIPLLVLIGSLALVSLAKIAVCVARVTSLERGIAEPPKPRRARTRRRPVAEPVASPAVPDPTA
jgi:hypothetical protein